jgi:hypothetical protein
MSHDPDAMPPLVRDFAEAVRYIPDDRAWLRLYGHILIEPDGRRSAAIVLENLLGEGSWDSLIWDHDLVPKVIEATGLHGEAREQLERVASWDGRLQLRVRKPGWRHGAGACAGGGRTHSGSGAPGCGVRAGGPAMKRRP